MVEYSLICYAIRFWGAIQCDILFHTLRKLHEYFSLKLFRSLVFHIRKFSRLETSYIHQYNMIVI